MLKGLMIALLAAPASAAAADGARMIEGAASYRERVALPESAYLSVETRSADGAFFASLTRRMDGAQVPAAFSLTAPADAPATLSVTIEVDGAVRWSGGPVDIPAGSGPHDVGMVRLVSDTRPPAPVRFECGAKELEVTFIGDTAAMKLAGKSIDLMISRSASGARYEAPADPSTWAWFKGPRATVSVGGEDLPACVEIGGVADFRAGGVEPGWDFTITGDRAALTTGYGAERRAAALPAPETEAGATLYRIAALGASVRIEDAICRDIATGTPHPKTVEVELGERRLSGCGGAPLDLLRGGEWLVEDIGGVGVIDASHATIAFGADGRASGAASCNRFTAAFTLTGERLFFEPAATTMMACPEALMNQERRFTDALTRVAGFDIDPTGALVLRSAAGEALVRARRD